MSSGLGLHCLPRSLDARIIRVQTDYNQYYFTKTKHTTARNSHSGVWRILVSSDILSLSSWDFLLALIV